MTVEQTLPEVRTGRKELPRAYFSIIAGQMRRNKRAMAGLILIRGGGSSL